MHLSESVDIGPMRITFRPDEQVYAVNYSVDITPDPLPENVPNPSFSGSLVQPILHFHLV